MHRGSIVIGIVVLPFLWTCCPTLWVQVNKDSPAPWPSVQVVGIAPEPYPIPASVPNRFDVFKCGNPTLGAPGFTDAPDPKNDRTASMAHALDALTWIEQTYGRPTIRKCDIRAKFMCAVADKSGLEAQCQGLHFDTAVTAAEAVVVNGRSVAVETHTFPTTDLALSSYVPGKNGDPVDVCLEEKIILSETLLSFVHLSDIQLRDPSITLTDRSVSRQLDAFDLLASFEYDEDLAYYNQYLVEALFATINATARAGEKADRPKFVIHTGDSIDSGAMSELGRFHVLIDRLHIPFFNLFGNHDVLVFGNLTPTSVFGDDTTCTSISTLVGKKMPIWLPNKLCVDQMVRCETCVGEDERALVARAKHADSRWNFTQGLKHDWSDSLPQLTRGTSVPYCETTAPKIMVDSFTQAHGFDLGTAEDTLIGAKLGYYAFATRLDKDRNAVFVALNSEDLEDGKGGIGGRVGPDQTAWLQRVLSCVADKHPLDLVFVFAHQPLSYIRADANVPTIESVLDTSKNVAGYFYGHSHEHSICGDHRDNRTCSKYWEVETASLVEFPQEGRIVRIKKISDDLAYLELTALRERLTGQDSELARYTALARRGAERDFCHTKRGDPKVRCSADLRPYRIDGRDANARLFFRLP